MSYSKFTAEKAVNLLGIKIIQEDNLFGHVGECLMSNYLRTVFETPSVFGVSSEAARRELIITPVLIEVFSVFHKKFAIFSCENFEVDKKLSLNGLADYLICLSENKAFIQSPIIAIAESKKNEPLDGLGQCVSELYAAGIFNHRKNNITEKLFGISTNGDTWIFGEYYISKKLFIIDTYRYSIKELPKLLGILTYMRDEVLRMYDNKMDNPQNVILE